jgi:N,N'-diacetylchitobiose transport system substrate-binding protein
VTYVKNRSLVLSAALVCAATLVGCGLVPGGSSRSTVDIWLMKDSVSDEFLERSPPSTRNSTRPWTSR